MKIRSIHIKNFFSIKDVFIVLSDTGVVSIEGKNRDSSGSNGVGKSTIYEAIVWGLFGRTIRKTVQDSLINVQAKKECEVTIILDNAEIKRGIKPPYLHLKLDGKTYLKESVTDTQKFIEEKLNISYKPFLVSHVFGQQNDIDFISASAEDKRLIVKTFLGLDEFFALREKFKSNKNEVFGRLKTYETLCISAKASYSRVENANTAISKELEEIKSKYNVSVLDSLSEIKLKEAKKSQARTKWDDATRLIDDLSKRLESTKKSLSKKEEKCGSCNTVIKINKEGITKAIKELEYQIDQVTTQAAEFMLEYKSIDIPISSVEFEKISNIESLKLSYQTNLKLLEEHKKSFEENKTNKEVANKQYQILTFWENAFSEQGIVKFIVHNVLDYLNEKCQIYLSILTNGKMTIEFDDEFNEKIKVHGNDTYYSSLSGGERKKVNFAILLGLQSLLAFTSRSRFDFMLLDEIVESIDDESVYNFYTLLKELSKDKLVMVISHNTVLKEHLINHQKIKLVKSKGITKLAQ
jgi:DNA repair exonuclease SbcCD ATPase subunit